MARFGMDSFGLKLGQLTGTNKSNPVYKNMWNLLTL